ncbi:MAG TPA: V-type ATP synthase subunit D [Nitrospiraceae bacterium]|jgi:V/A-type H+-transporting ATPase subunit D|nr:V-type ATP synthase subunit D [Nitrospiraceae bacterium]
MEPLGRTRMNLLLLKRQIEAAERGLALLRSKREALVREFFTAVGRVAERRGELEAAMAQGRSSLAVALGMEGRAALRSAGFAAQRNMLIDLTERNVWGVRFPDLHYAPVARPADARGYALSGVSAYIDETARRFETVLDVILRSVSVELRLKKLGAEIKKVTRRINALEEIVMPSLKRQVREIRQTLEEREREDLFRMKRFKAVSGERTAGSN